MLLACFQSYIWSLMSGVIPRLCQTAFMFAQPFLVSTTIEYVGDESADATYGRGLIGAWALTYLGIAVSSMICITLLMLDLAINLRLPAF